MPGGCGLPKTTTRNGYSQWAVRDGSLPIVRIQSSRSPRLSTGKGGTSAKPPQPPKTTKISKISKTTERTKTTKTTKTTYHILPIPPPNVADCHLHSLRILHLPMWQTIAVGAPIGPANGTGVPRVHLLSPAFSCHLLCDMACCWFVSGPGAATHSAFCHPRPVTRWIHARTHARTRACTHTIARQTGTTQVPSVKILVSWIVKQDRACPTPIGAFLQHR